MSSNYDVITQYFRAYGLSEDDSHRDANLIYSCVGKNNSLQYLLDNQKRYDEYYKNYHVQEPHFVETRAGISVLLASALGFLMLTSIGYLRYGKALPYLFSKKVTSKESSELQLTSSFLLKKWLYITGILALNGGLSFIVYKYGGLTVIFVLIVLFKSKDILLVTLQSLYYFYWLIVHNLFCGFTYSVKPKSVRDIKNLVTFIPFYQEAADQLKTTITSVTNDNKNDMLNNLVCIVSDGSIIERNVISFSTVLEKCYSYESWKNIAQTLRVSYGFLPDNVPCVLIEKTVNMGKKDSIILLNDVFNFARDNMPDANKDIRGDVRESIKTLYQGFSDIDYIFYTDADSVICKDSLINLVESIESRNAVASCGLVQANIPSTFIKGSSIFKFVWYVMQNFQYLYGQYIRRNSESLWGKVTCLPGCITMIKVDEKASKALGLYSENTSQDEFLKFIVQHLGTDRRLTNSYLFQDINTYTVFDDRAKCLTVPPYNLHSYVTQRRRWGSNSYFNTLFSIFSRNVFLITRITAFLDYSRMSLSYFRTFNTVLFIVKLAFTIQDRIDYKEQQCFICPSQCESHIGQEVAKDILTRLAPCIVIIFTPLLYFVVMCVFKSGLRSKIIELVVGYLIVKVVGVILSIMAVTNTLYFIGDTMWNKLKQTTNNQNTEMVTVTQTPPV